LFKLYLFYCIFIFSTELDDAKEDLHQHRLRPYLEAAIRASNAQYDDTKITAKLDVKIKPVV